MKDTKGSASYQPADSKRQAGSLRHPADRRERAYAFALPRLIVRLTGRTARRAELSRWEAYGTGILVFGVSCVFAARLLLPLVRLGPLQLLALLLLPFGMWVAFLILYFIIAQLAAVLRRLGLYAAVTNNPLQHAVIMSLTTLIALAFLRDECDWVKLLGAFWLALLILNLTSVLVEKLRHEP